MSAASTITSSDTTARTRGGPNAVLWTMSAALGLVVAAVSALNVALPDMAGDLRATATEMLWITNAYALAFAALLIPASAIGERFGRRRVLLVGLGLFTAGAVASALSTSPIALIAFRAVSGVGAALVMPLTLSILTAVFPREQRGRVAGIWAGVAGAGGSFGLLASGGLLEAFDWTSVFWLTTAISVVTIVATVLFVPESFGPRKPADPVGGIMSVLGLGAVVFAVIEGPEWGWTDARVLVTAAAGLAVLVAFVVWELRSKHPMLEMRLFRDRAFATGTLSTALQFFALFGLFYVLILFLQQVLGYSPLEAGLAILPMGIGLMVLSPFVERFVERFGPSVVSFAGLALLGAGFLYGAVALGADSSYWAVLPMLVPIGAGLSLATVPATLGILNGAPRSHADQASAVNNASREIGGALGIAVFGSLLNDRYSSSVADGTSGLPAEVAQGAEESIGFAKAAAAQLGERGTELARLADTAFGNGMTLALVVGGVLVIATAFITLVFGPKRGELDLASEAELLAGGPEPDPEPQPAPRRPIGGLRPAGGAA
jgi:EmrB/QacA subfamily drug resistance transporter